MTSRNALTGIVCLAAAALAMTPTPAVAATAGQGEGDMYQPWIPPAPGNKPSTKDRRQSATTSRTGYMVDSTESNAVQPIVITPGRHHTAQQIREARRSAAPALAAATAGDLAPAVAASPPDSAPAGPPLGAGAVVIALALLGSAWLLRPRRG